MKLSSSQKLNNLRNAMIDDTMAMTDGEILAEAKENGEDIDAIVAHFRQVIDQIIEKRDRLKSETDI